MHQVADSLGASSEATASTSGEDETTDLLSRVRVVHLERRAVVSEHGYFLGPNAIACGSDAGVFAHGDNAREIELMSAWGMGPKRALQAATTVAAKVPRRETQIGRIANGYLADIVILDANPHTVITALRRIHTVIKDDTPIDQVTTREPGTMSSVPSGKRTWHL